MYQATHKLTNRAEVKAILGKDYVGQANKVIDHIDRHCRTWLAHTPFIAISSSAATGAMDVSPKGDPAGFVKILDQHTLAIPDRPGNHRGDTFFNVLENPHIGIMCMIPNRREVLRINGTAEVVVDPELLAEMSVNQKRPALALLVRVSEAFFHCGKAMIRSAMWDPQKWASVDGLPTYAEALKDHAKLPNPLRDLEVLSARNESEDLY